MRGSSESGASAFFKALASNYIERFLPAYPVLSLFCFLGAALFFFLSLTALILGIWITLSVYVPEIAAIWYLFGTLFVLFIIFLIGARLFFRPKKTRNIPKSGESFDQLLMGFLEGFFSR